MVQFTIWLIGRSPEVLFEVAGNRALLPCISLVLLLQLLSSEEKGDSFNSVSVAVRLSIDVPKLFIDELLEFTDCESFILALRN